VVEANHCSTGCSVSIDPTHVGRVVDCEVSGSGEGVVGKENGSGGSEVISYEDDDMVVVRGDSKGVIGERTEGVSDLDVRGVSFEDECDGDGRSLCQVEDGGLVGSSIGVGVGTDNVEDAVVSRGCLDPLGVVRIESGDEGGSSSGHGG
jgi:hypothetical protein